MDEPGKTDKLPKTEDPLQVQRCKRLIVSVLYPRLYSALCALERSPTPENEEKFEIELKKVRSQKGGLR
jgi:hypothetical protein